MMGGSDNGVRCVDNRRAVSASSLSRLAKWNPMKRECWTYTLYRTNPSEGFIEQREAPHPAPLVL